MFIIRMMSWQVLHYSRDARVDALIPRTSPLFLFENFEDHRYCGKLTACNKVWMMHRYSPEIPNRAVPSASYRHIAHAARSTIVEI
jgi:hypothetical protein